MMKSTKKNAEDCSKQRRGSVQYLPEVVTLANEDQEQKQGRTNQHESIATKIGENKFRVETRAVECDIYIRLRWCSY